MTNLETTAREMLKTGADDNHSRILIKMAFRAMWSNSLSITRIERIAAALANLDESNVDLQDELTRMTKAKILRSRMIQGVRHYEVNY